MDKDQTINLNQNAAQCLQNTNNFGSTTIQNICNGKTFIVPWGSADWLVCFMLIGVGLFVFALLGSLAALIWRD